MVSARSRLIARADSYLPKAQPMRKLEAPRIMIGGTANEESAAARKNLVKQDYDPLNFKLNIVSIEKEFVELIEILIKNES